METKELPAIAVSAGRMAQAEYERTMNNLASQTLEAMGLKVGEWVVDFQSGKATRIKSDG